MKVLIGCEVSAKVRDAFRARGHDAWSCDLSPTDGDPRFHFQQDVREVAYWARWDLGIFHPPCTRLTLSGVRWLHERNLWADLQEAAALFNACMSAPIPRIAVENPIQHGHAAALIGVPWTQIVQPWQYGHPETKATCLWLKALPPLRPTKIVAGREARIHRMSPSADRAKLRSEMYDGLAEAMADQWGSAPLDLVTQMEAA